MSDNGPHEGCCTVVDTSCCQAEEHAYVESPEGSVMLAHARKYSQELTKKWGENGGTPLTVTGPSRKAASSGTSYAAMTSEEADVFVKEHFSESKDDTWKFNCNCRYVSNCSIRRYDPRVKTALSAMKADKSPTTE